MLKKAKQLLASQSQMVSPREVALEPGCGEGSRERFRCPSGPEVVRASAPARRASPALRYSGSQHALTCALTPRSHVCFQSRTLTPWLPFGAAECWAPAFLATVSLPSPPDCSGSEGPFGKAIEAFASADWNPVFICSLTRFTKLSEI